MRESSVPMRSPCAGTLNGVQLANSATVSLSCRESLSPLTAIAHSCDSIAPLLCVAMFLRHRQLLL